MWYVILRYVMNSDLFKEIFTLEKRGVTSPAGFIEDILVEVGGMYIPTDFVILDMGENDLVPIL